MDEWLKQMDKWVINSSGRCGALTLRLLTFGD